VSKNKLGVNMSQKNSVRKSKYLLWSQFITI